MNISSNGFELCVFYLLYSYTDYCKENTYSYNHIHISVFYIAKRKKICIFKSNNKLKEINFNLLVVCILKAEFIV